MKTITTKINKNKKQKTKQIKTVILGNFQEKKKNEVDFHLRVSVCRVGLKSAHITSNVCSQTQIATATRA